MTKQRTFPLRNFDTFTRKKEIVFEDLSSKVKDFYLIDIRKPEEIRHSGKLPGAYNIPLDEIEAALQMDNETFYDQYVIPSFHCTENKVVIYCRSGRRVSLATEIFQKFGLANILFYRGSFQDWVANGGPLEQVMK
ncbi:UNVERIFIED_CONTAM: hypothetical protein RMT77_001536 [Armadillidium vulgare]